MLANVLIQRTLRKNMGKQLIHFTTLAKHGTGKGEGKY